MYENAERAVKDANVPDFLRWYRIQGHAVFPIYSQDASLCASAIAFLVKKAPTGSVDLGRHGLHREGGGEWMAIEFPLGVSLEIATDLIRDAIDVLDVPIALG